MGTSKLTMISGLYVILGFYITAFNSADEATGTIASNAAISAQTEQLAQTGVSMALITMGNNSSIEYFNERSLSTMGGRVTFSANHPATLSSSERLITSRGVISSTQVEATAVIHFDKGRWRIERIYFSSTVS
jgi:hypothetical protein